MVCPIRAPRFPTFQATDKVMSKVDAFGKPKVVLWVCSKCGTGIKTPQLQPRCRVCGFREGT